jgi:hypothetical protein
VCAVGTGPNSGETLGNRAWMERGAYRAGGDIASAGPTTTGDGRRRAGFESSKLRKVEETERTGRNWVEMVVRPRSAAPKTGSRKVQAQNQGGKGVVRCGGWARETQ